MGDEANQAVNQLLQTANTTLQIIARLVEFRKQYELMDKRMAMEQMKYDYFMNNRNFFDKDKEKENIHNNPQRKDDVEKNKEKESFIENPNYLDEHDREAIKNLNKAEKIYEKDKDKSFSKAEINRSNDFSKDIAKVFAEQNKYYQDVENKLNDINDEITSIFTEAKGELNKEQEDKVYNLYLEKVDLTNQSLDKLDDITRDLNKVFKEHEGDFLNKESIDIVKNFEDSKKDLRSVKRLTRDLEVDKTLNEGRQNLSKKYKKLDLSRDLSKLNKDELKTLKDDINNWKKDKGQLLDSDNIFLEKEFIHFHNDKYNNLSDLTDVLKKTENYLDNKLSEIDGLLSKELNKDNLEKNTEDISFER